MSALVLWGFALTPACVRVCTYDPLLVADRGRFLTSLRELNRPYGVVRRFGMRRRSRANTVRPYGFASSRIVGAAAFTNLPSYMGIKSAVQKNSKKLLTSADKCDKMLITSASGLFLLCPAPTRKGGTTSTEEGGTQGCLATK